MIEYDDVIDYKTLISFENVIRKKFKGNSSDIENEMKTFLKTLEEKQISKYPQIVVNYSIDKINNENLLESEIFVISDRNNLKKIQYIYDTQEQLIFNNVSVFRYKGTMYNFNKCVDEFISQIERKDMIIDSSVYIYIPEEVDENEILTKEVAVSCFVKVRNRK